MSTVKPEIPTIDIQPWLTGSNPDIVVEQVKAACKTYGFFQLVGHGVPLELQEEILECAKRFFSLPLEAKERLAKDPLTGRGYEVIGSQALNVGEAPDEKEAMRIGREVPKNDPKFGTYLYGSNHWPELPDHEFREPVMRYREHMLRLAEEIMKILEKGLAYQDGIFQEFMEDPVASVKLLHYPSRDVNSGVAKIGAGAHTDFGAITLLLQHPGQEGLEVMHPVVDSWIPVPTRPDTYVVNIGDVLGAWTSGQYRSATHRVVNQSNDDRYSVPFFYDGTMSARMDSLDGSGDPKSCKTVGQHFKEKFTAADSVRQ